MRNSPSVGEPGYLPYCGRCTGLVRMKRGQESFECPICGLKSRRINGEDMFDRTAPISCVAISCEHYNGQAYSADDGLCPDCRSHEDRMAKIGPMGTPQCDHNWAEVDVEPPYDVCTSCGLRRD